MIKIFKVIIKIKITMFDKDFCHGIGVRQAFGSHKHCLAFLVHFDGGYKT